MTIITVILGTIALIATLIDMYMQYWRKSKSKWGWRNHYEVKCTQINFDVVGKEAIDFKSLSK